MSTQTPALSPADRMRQFAAALAGDAAADGVAERGLRRHTEGSEEYLHRLAESLRRAGYVVHAPEDPACAPLRATLAAQEPVMVPVEPRGPVRALPTPTAGTVAHRLLRALSDGHHDLEGMTAREAEDAAGVPAGGWRRVSDLVHLGLVVPLLDEHGAQIIRRAPSGGPGGRVTAARVWDVSLRGVELLLELDAADRERRDTA